MKTILEAYALVLDAVNDLREAGIEVKVTPMRSYDGEPKPETYSLPREKWVDVTFRVEHSGHAIAAKEAADKLGWAGITFDTSGSSGERDWQIDWSFNVGDTPDGEWEARREDVEGMIDGMEGSK